ncbi:MAG: PHP domain-containing protein [Clostridia bacterium]|nr:PHP domain-containing protein [Clostridia bacterium]
MPKFELHLHTSQCDITAYVAAEELVRMYADQGYQGIVVTDHYISLFDDWFGAELIGLNHRQRIKRWLRGYEAAKRAGEEYGVTVLPGAEVRFDGYPNDYLLYGVEEDFFYEAPRLNQLKNVEEMLAILPDEVCVVQAHPFRNKMVVADPSVLWGIEVHNGGTDLFRNQMARSFAEHYGKPMTSGSDTHRPHAIGKGGIETQEPILTPKDLIRTLRSGAYTLIENGCRDTEKEK